MSRPARLAIGVISAGRVGAVLGAALARAGHTVIAASGVSRGSVRRAEELLPGVPLLSPPEVAAGADLVLLALPDDALAGTVRGLVATESVRSGQIVVHTSGAHGVEVLDPVAEIGALPLALHPVMTFTGRAEDLDRLVACCFGVTAPDGDEAAWSVGEALVVEMRAEPVRIPPAAARCTTPRWCTAPTIWPRWSVRAPSCCGTRGSPIRSGCSARCCRPRWTTRCGTATGPSPGRWPGETPEPSAPTSRCSPSTRRGCCRPTGRSPPAPRTARRTPGCCDPDLAPDVLAAIEGQEEQ
jgi:hypothetical protein